MKLSELKVDTRSVWMEFDDSMPGFEVELNYIPRSEMTAIVKGCQKQKQNRVTRQIETSLDEEKFIDKFVERGINDWKGLTPENIQDLVPVKVSGAEEGDEIPFSHNNAVFLLKESQWFDEWVNEKISDVDSFRQRGEDEA